MKIAVIGYSGAGKSTLARALGERYDIPVLHLDRVQHTSNWQERDREEAHRMVHDFMERPQWVIDGTYSGFEFQRRLEEADKIVFLNLPRLTCFLRALKRFFRFRNGTRPDMADGCAEKMDFEFVWWLLWKGRTRQKRKKFQRVMNQYPEKTVVLKSQKDIDRYLEGVSC